MSVNLPGSPHRVCVQGRAARVEGTALPPGRPGGAPPRLPAVDDTIRMDSAASSQSFGACRVPTGGEPPALAARAAWREWVQIAGPYRRVLVRGGSNEPLQRRNAGSARRAQAAQSRHRACDRCFGIP
jgi:hypothetical protein